MYSLTDSPDDSEGVIILHCHIGLPVNRPFILVEHGQQWIGCNSSAPTLINWQSRDSLSIRAVHVMFPQFNVVDTQFISILSL